MVTELLRKVDRRIIRFLFVGVMNTLFGYAVFSFLIFLHIHYSIALLLSTVMGVLFNFKSTGRLVFDSKNNRLIYRFVAVYAILYGINLILLKALSLLTSNMYITSAILIVPMAILSFLLNKTFVFRRSYEKED